MLVGSILLLQLVITAAAVIKVGMTGGAPAVKTAAQQVEL